MHQAIERGLTFIDTASSYEGYDRNVGTPGGVAEEYLGRILKGKRDQVVLLTKIANALGPGPHQQGRVQNSPSDHSWRIACGGCRPTAWTS